MHDHSNTRSGKVISVHEDGLTVRVQRVACERCEAGRGCGAGLMNRLLVPGYFDVPLSFSQVPVSGRSVGSSLTLAFDESLQLHLAFRVYGVTALGFVLFAAFAYFSAHSHLSGGLLDLFVLILGLAGAILASWLCSRIANSMQWHDGISCVAVNRHPLSAVIVADK